LIGWCAFIASDVLVTISFGEINVSVMPRANPCGGYVFNDKVVALPIAVIAQHLSMPFKNSNVTNQKLQEGKILVIIVGFIKSFNF
jgi:hypothetical protein